MPFSGSAPNQTYSRSDGTRTGAAVCAQEKAAALNDTAALADLRENDLATAINSLWLRNGGNQPSADLPMNSHKFTGLADGSDRTDSVTLGQIQDGNLFYAEASGTANAIELATTPSFAASEGVMAIFVAEADSTSTVTVDFNGDGAIALQVGGAACSGGEINNGQAHIIVHDGTQWQLVNPLWPNITAIAALTGAAGKLVQFTGAGAAEMIDTTAAGLPSGTVAVFNQTAAPTGWTKDTSDNNNSALRIVTGSVSSGGSVDFTTAFASKTPSGTVGGTTLTTDQIPLHGHPFRPAPVSSANSDLTGGFMLSDTNDANVAAFTGTPSETAGEQIGGTGGGASHTHTFTGDAINLAVKYVDVIRATKD